MILESLKDLQLLAGGPAVGVGREVAVVGDQIPAALSPTVPVEDGVNL